MSDNLDHHHDVYHYGGDPTPPTPPEMPKPDATGVSGVYTCWIQRDGTTAIERYAEQQREEATKAIAAFTAEAEQREQLQAENAALREACDDVAGMLYDDDLDVPHMIATLQLALHSSPAACGKDKDE